MLIISSLFAGETTTRAERPSLPIFPQNPKSALPQSDARAPSRSPKTRPREELVSSDEAEQKLRLRHLLFQQRKGVVSRDRLPLQRVSLSIQSTAPFLEARIYHVQETLLLPRYEESTQFF